MAAKRTKRDSTQVDKLMSEVDKLHSKGMSVNKACQQVGIQPTVYYFRKRKDVALAKNDDVAQSIGKSTLALHEHKDLESLTREYRELENRLNAIKLKIAEKVMSGESKSRNT